MALGQRGGDVDPVQHVEAGGAGGGRIQGDDGVPHGLAAVRRYHRADLLRGVEHDGGAGPAQQGGDADRGGLVPAGAGQHEGVGGTGAARVDQQRRGAAAAPAGPGGRIEGDTGDAVLVDAVGLADDDAAIGGIRAGEQALRVAHGQPGGVAEIVGARAQQQRRTATADRERPGQAAEAQHHHAGAEQGGCQKGGVGVTQHIVQGVALAEQAGQAQRLRLDGEHRGDRHAGDAADPHQAAEQPGAVDDDAGEHQHGGAAQRGDGPGAPEQILVPAHLLRGQAAEVGEAEQDAVAVDGVGDVPDPPEQPEWPELQGDPQPDPDQVVAGAVDHSAAAASGAAARPAVVPTRRALPPCVLARVLASSKRARPSQCRITLL